mgnify:CR=1 FL=1
MFSKFILLLHWILRPVDKFLDKLTSYRLVLYFLLTVLGWSMLASLITDQVPFRWYEILGSAAWLVAVCRASNWSISYLLNIPRNQESDLITALILALILNPASDLAGFFLLAAAGSIAMISKYLLVIGRRHVFNPAALGALTVGPLLGFYASWWVGLSTLTPIILLGGMLIVRKMRRYLMVSVFMSLYLAIVAVETQGGSSQIINSWWTVLTASPVLFFVYVMLLEPLTSPKRPYRASAYAGLVALMYGLPGLGLAPEAALLIGNLAAFLLEPGRRLVLAYAGKVKEADGLYSFIFSSKHRVRFQAGQYMEWTIPANRSDSRGNRRYLTISSAPTEEQLMVTVRQPSPASRFKQKLKAFKPGDKILASPPAGSFVAPVDPAQKIVMVAGGVGITPFRSMVKSWLDTNQRRDAVLIYAANHYSEFAFTDLFKAASAIGVQTTYIITDPQKVPAGWRGQQGSVSGQLIKASVPDYRQRIFYVSGPYGFVSAVRDSLLKKGVSLAKIRTDYFPGYG